jgi:hypothetical protein
MVFEGLKSRVERVISKHPGCVLKQLDQIDDGFLLLVKQTNTTLPRTIRRSIVNEEDVERLEDVLSLNY